VPDEPFEQPVVDRPGRVIHRRAGRIILLDPQDRVLLSHDTWNGEHWWTTPGGGVEGEEDPGAAALREVAEETGFRDVELGPLVIRHHWRGLFYDYVLDQHEWIYVGRTAGGEPDTSGLEGLELEFMIGFRWWSLDELQATTDTVYPPSLRRVLADVLSGEPPTEPYDDGEWELDS
jgi:8-oxo-dGTP pyrophosphatase MutT (NUDIX family)